LRDAGVDDTQFGVLGVEAEDEIRVALLDAATQGLEVQSFAGIPLRHVVYLLLRRGEHYEPFMVCLFLLSKMSQTKGRRYGNFTTCVSRNGLVPR
jgi:hypothetical protein